MCCNSRFIKLRVIFAANDLFDKSWKSFIKCFIVIPNNRIVFPINISAKE